jgi:hypothetical protein
MHSGAAPKLSCEFFGMRTAWVADSWTPIVRDVLKVSMASLET